MCHNPLTTGFDMIKAIRQILLTEYIGSILVALLGCQAIIVLATAVLRDLLWYCYSSRSTGVFRDTRPPFQWDSLVFSAVSAALYLLFAYLLARWLYLPKAPTLLTADEPSPDESQQS
jgi:hypothetical protein